MILETLERRAFVGVTLTVLVSGCRRSREAEHASNVDEKNEADEEPSSRGDAPAGRSDELLVRQLTELEEELGGRVGVFAHFPSTGWTLSHREDERFAMCSTFKWVLAAAILERVDAGSLHLESEVPFGEEDLQQWAPVTKERISEGKLTIAELCHAAVTLSDNTAANLLLEKVGGPAGLTAFFRKVGDGVSRLDRNEPMLNMNTSGDPQDTTSPRAMATAMQEVLTTDVLSSKSVETLTTWLLETETGQGRLKAGLPAGTQWGHKTGGGNRGATNDVGVFWTKAGEPCFVAVYLSGSEKPMNQLEAAHARIARWIAEEVL